MRRHLLIYVNEQRFEVAGADAFLSLTTWLRDHLGLCGTKVVCAEGDCGSCTVLMGRPDGAGMKYVTVCACIQYLFQLDCTHIITIEGLKYGDKLNPIQAAMVQHHGAQCGFCTPGIVVAMYHLFAVRELPTAPMDSHTLRRGLVGNLCRCTGYQPIVNAGMAVLPEAILPITALHENAAINIDLARCERDEVLVEAGEQSVYKPSTLAQAAGYRAAHNDAVLVAGGTDLGVLAYKGNRTFQRVISTRGLQELRDLQVGPGGLVVGASVSIDELERATACVLPDFSQMLGWFGSPPIKRAATMGGNIANGSPIGDTMPALFVLKAELELVGARETRRVDINAFYTGYRTNVMREDELLARVYIPLPSADEHFRVYKVSQRKDLDISTFAAAFWMRLEGDSIAELRIAYGGVGPTILRLVKTERFLQGMPHRLESWQSATATALAEIKPISDVRGSATYRELLAANCLVRFFQDACGAETCP